MSHQNSHQHMPSAILFNRDHAKSIEFDFRLPPISIGARRMRPSSKEVMKALKTQKRFKKQQANQMIDTSYTGTSNSRNDDGSGDGQNEYESEAGEKDDSKEVTFHGNESLAFVDPLNDESLQLQEEIDEITCAGRAAYKNLPALLTAPMVQQAQTLGMIPLQSTSVACRRCEIFLDDDMAQLWAHAIQKSMKEAEHTRNGENMRPMAYRLVPEPWKRHRHACIVKVPSSENPCLYKHDGVYDFSSKNIDGMKSIVFSKPIYSGNEEMHTAHSIFFDYFYNNFRKLHMSCGAKFGCDYLLYDGNRIERHAFAGVRILPSKHMNGKEIEFPLPTAYDLHGFVRGLNTAGKLALLVTVIKQEEDIFRVVVVDLALEKILSAPAHLKKKEKFSDPVLRKNIGKHLSKVNHE
mmetsp:Transcript_12626/g.23675  ORF Transcript_12626/g.23675 Transcript_12626/m.23675 type:complete len:408 (-) Transcript_12626:1545-2768(-)